MPPRRITTALPALVLASLGVGCTQFSGDPRFERSSDLVAIESTVPGADGVVRTEAQLDFCFDATIDPASIDEAGTVLSSGNRVFDTDLNLQPFPWRPPGSSVGLAEEPWCRGSVLSVLPASELEHGLRYRVRLFPSPRGWAGERLDTSTEGWIVTPEGDLEFFLEFDVEADDTDGDTDGDPEDEAPTLGALFEPGMVFDPERAACSCHRDPKSVALARLDLRSEESAFEGLVARDRLEPTGYPMVTPGFPAESYLVHKLLRDADDHPLEGVLGEAMPPAGPLPHADISSVAHWVAGGALR